jgi:hypothetical protein
MNIYRIFSMSLKYVVSGLTLITAEMIYLVNLYRETVFVL